MRHDPGSITKALSVLAFVLCTGLGNSAFAAQADWSITKDVWTESDERKFSEFVQKLGESRCNTVDACLKSPANPYRTSDPVEAQFAADCGRFPYLLRAYFAWKNGLPFSVASRLAPVENLGKDLRYSPKGNVVTARRDVVQKSEKPIDGMNALKGLLVPVFSGTFRFNSETSLQNGLYFDLYPVRISRDSIRPGTVIYDANGHVAVVYKVEDDGRIRFFDSHPDNTVTRSVYGEKFARSSPHSGAGFKNFKPLRLVGARRSSSGTFVGGVVQAPASESLPGYSLEQFFGTRLNPERNWKKSVFENQGREVAYYDFVRLRMAVGDLKYRPVEEMLNGMDTLCNDIKDRAFAIESASKSTVYLKAHPERLPENIYGTSGEWEDFSSPSRDARLKTSFLELRNQVQRFVELSRAGSDKIVYQGNNLPVELRNAYEIAAEQCKIQYTRSNGTRVAMSYHHVLDRLFKLSFDPYDCPELRWGASDQRELSTCTNDSNKMRWYNAEQGLRNQLERTYDLKMNFSLFDLESSMAGTGPRSAPDVDLRRYLYSL